MAADAVVAIAPFDAAGVPTYGTVDQDDAVGLVVDQQRDRGLFSPVPATRGLWPGQAARRDDVVATDDGAQFVHGRDFDGRVPRVGLVTEMYRRSRSR